MRFSQSTLLIGILTSVWFSPNHLTANPPEDPPPILMVIANQDFYYPDYILPRQAIEAAGLTVEVAAPNLATAFPHGGVPTVEPDLALADANADNYSAILFVGGWGASIFHYDFPGTYHNAAYQGTLQLRQTVNDLINQFDQQEKVISALCFGVTVLGWARIDGESPVDGMDVVGYPFGGPAMTVNGESYGASVQPTSWHMEANGANFLPSGSVGDPTTSADDVIVDGNIITGESFESGSYFGSVVASEVQNWYAAENSFLPVLMVIANQDFYYQEYNDTRTSLEAAGLTVHVAATTLDPSTPHPNSGQGMESGIVIPDIALADVSAANYETIVFIGGWGSSAYQYDFPGTYNEPAYNGDAVTKDIVNNLILDFVSQEKYVNAICFSVTILSWARYLGASILDGKTVSSYQSGSPQLFLDGVFYNFNEIHTSWHMDQNDATMVPSDSIGDPTTDVDDVIVDTSNGIRVITAQNYNSALAFGTQIAVELGAL